MRKETTGEAIVACVADGSPAGDAGIQAGDRICAIDRHLLRDVVDCYTLLAEDSSHELEVKRGDARATVSLPSSNRPVGIEWESPIFGPVTRCNNRCAFCFVDQLPGGLRETLYVKDDDYRLSFLSGNFVTLTNLNSSDVRRIVYERLSPLYVSLHATEPGVRRRIFGGRQANRALQILGELLEARIKVHLQIVLMRGVNDAEHLERTLADIESRFPEAVSIGVVPVGMSRGGSLVVPTEAGYDADSAALVIEQIERWRSRFGDAGPFAADEFFYLAGEDPPPESYYSGYPQLENGIGIARLFKEGLLPYLSEINERGWMVKRNTAVITSPVGAWALEPMNLGKLGVDTLICENSLFGERVTVSGLLPGSDVINLLKVTPGVERVLVPEVALSDGIFIDGVSLDDVARQTDLELRSVTPGAGAILEAIGFDAGDEG